MIAAGGQMQANTIDQAAGVWPVVERLAARAQDEGAELLVLPEVTYPAYYLGSAERYRRPDIERSAGVLERFAQTAARHHLWLVAGFVEESGDQLYNSAAVFDREGALVGVARKNFLWDCDHQWFTPGEALSVFDTEFGRMGVLICADARVPEIPATLVRGGAQFIVQPTAWVNTSEIRRTYRNIQPDFLIRARAREFRVPFVCCSKAGWEGEALEYVGQSQIVSATGQVLAAAPLGGEHVVATEVSPSPSPTVRIEEGLRERLLSAQPPFRPEHPAGTCQVSLRPGAEVIAGALVGAGVRMARLTMRELESFAPARCHALDGVQVLLVRGRVADDTLLRTRAAENRVFAIMATDTAHQVVDPDGQIAWRGVDWPNELDLDLRRAEVKLFNPRTDLWAGRRVASYRL